LKRGDIDVEVDGGGSDFPGRSGPPFWSAFTHVVRNAIDHGLEPPEARRSAGKCEHGQLRLSAVRMGRSVRIEMADDGRGIDWNKVA
jgi:two-component system chemotaxis sensor kinase CheA